MRPDLTAPALPVPTTPAGWLAEPPTRPGGRRVQAGDGINPPLAAVLTAFMDAAMPVVKRHLRPDACIATTRIAIDVLGRFGYTAVPLACEAWVLNPPAVAFVGREGFPAATDADAVARWKAAGGWVVTVGATGVTGPGRWGGHLVAVIRDRALIDLSLAQADRPQHGLVVPPLVAALPPGFPDPTPKAQFALAGGAAVSYTHRPGDDAYRAAPDWRDLSNTRMLSSVIADRMRAAGVGRRGGAPRRR